METTLHTLSKSKRVVETSASPLVWLEEGKELQEFAAVLQWAARVSTVWLRWRGRVGVSEEVGEEEVDHLNNWGGGSIRLFLSSLLWRRAQTNALVTQAQRGELSVKGAGAGHWGWRSVDSSTEVAGLERAQVEREEMDWEEVIKLPGEDQRVSSRTHTEVD
jgi:hypothetical protein